MSFYEYWHETNKNKGNLRALEYFGNNWTFNDVESMITDYAKSISSLGLKNGDTITICVPFIPSTIGILYAANMLGIQINFLSPELLGYNTKKYLDETETNTLVILDRFYPAVAKHIGETNVKNIVVTSLGDDAPDFVKPKLVAPDIRSTYNLPENINYSNIEEFKKAGEGTIIRIKSLFILNSTAVVLFTGGSTGIPKGVELYNEKINRMSQIYEELGLQYPSGDRNMLLIPPNHPTSFIHGLTSPWSCYDGGVTQVCQPIYNKYTFYSDIINLRVNGAIAAPSHYAALSQDDKLMPGSLVDFKNSTCGGETVPFELAEFINKRLKYAGSQYQLMNVYGMSEAGPMAICTPYTNGLGNSVGRPVPGVEARIVDDYGNILGNNQRGNLQIKSECAMKGYFKQPELTRQFYTEDGFAKTGDIASRDDSGYYYVPGRESDSFVAKSGRKIYLFDIENQIYKANPDAILEAEAIALPIQDSTNKIPVVHAVLTQESLENPYEIIKDLSEECKTNLDEEEIPQGFKIRTGFGTNNISGKRDSKSLINERTEYYASSELGFEERTFTEMGDIYSEITDTEEIKIFDQAAGVPKRLILERK